MKNTAVVFAGQGAQTVGMGKDLAEAFPECRTVYEKADEVLGYRLSGLCFEGPIEELTKSNHCQPAIFVTSIACFHALLARHREFAPIGTAGLSLGEWSALHMAGALTFEDALTVLEARGRFMQEACDERDGAMVSIIGLTPAKVGEIAAAAGVEVANLNSEQQIVLSGERSGIAEAERLANDAGAKRSIILNVAGAFHSSLMQSAADRLEDVLARIEVHEPEIPVVANVTGRPHGDVNSIRRDMVRQVTNSVQWLSSIEWFRTEGAVRYVECGPGRVLTGLIKRIDSGAGLHNVNDGPSLDKTVESLG